MLMDHTAGLQNVPMTTVEIQPSPDFVQLALCAELEDEPGASYSYNNKAVNLLAGVVERADGRKLDDFAREELLRPLGIPDTLWSRDSVGNPHAMSGLALRSVDLVTLGNFLLQRGVWHDERLIDEAWFVESLDASVDEGIENALLWLHEFETEIEVNQNHLEVLREAEAEPDVMEAFRSLEGVHRSDPAFFIPLLKTLRPSWRDRIPAGVQAFNHSSGRHLAYRAEGDLGQYLLAFPRTKLVVARLISEATLERIDPSFKIPPQSLQEHLRRLEPFMFVEFQRRVAELSGALNESA